MLTSSVADGTIVQKRLDLEHVELKHAPSLPVENLLVSSSSRVRVGAEENDTCVGGLKNPSRWVARNPVART